MLKNQNNLRGIKEQLEAELESAPSNDGSDIKRKITKVEGALEVFEGLEKKYALVDRHEWEILLLWVNDARCKLSTIAFESLVENSRE